MHYTIGKRRGFEVFGAHEPHFVLKINADKNEIVVGSKDDLAQKIVDEDEFECEAKIRYRSPKLEASVKIDKQNKTAVVALSQNALGVAQGQLCVMYDGERVIASGFIK